ncbi:MAG TPA: hypothetical protein VKX17_15525 [Planctomycetota bacterium]|nr:hypothetical protein [Planctomycetota bacterium]
MAKSSGSSKRDGDTLRKLPSGLEIVRRKKHEPIDFLSLDAADRKKLTGKIFGSKFASTWDLDRVTNFIAQHVASNGWDSGTGPASMDVLVSEIAGYANGKIVHAIRIVSDGRYVHAYPVEDRT